MSQKNASPPRPETPPARYFFGRRIGHPLRRRQKDLLAARLPLYSLGGGGDLAAAVGAFAAGRPLWMEVGFGSGEHLFDLIDRHPHKAFIGCEVFLNGLAHFLGLLEPPTPDVSCRLRLFSGEAQKLLAQMPPQSLQRLYLLFPDPWPKTRHHKRRFVQADVVDLLARLLEPGGLFIFASDSAPYVEWVLERMTAAAAAFEALEALSPEAQEPLKTRYQQKAAAAGRQCVRLIFRRR